MPGLLTLELKMLNTLIKEFSARDRLPIEIGEIVEKIGELGIQDEVFLFEADTDPTKVRGAFHQFTYRKTLYGEPQLVTHIVYSKNVSLPWQRLICAKELVHIFDSIAARTDTEDETSKLLDRLVGPLSTEDYGLVDLQTAKDRLALYQALPLLLPDAALEVARQAVSEHMRTVDQVADWACVPTEFIHLMLREEWKALNGLLCHL